MGLFDSFDFSDPNTMAMLGAIQGAGQAAKPSRLPVPFGAVLGNMAGGLAQGAAQGQAYRANQAKMAAENLQNANALINYNLTAPLFGNNTLSMKDLYSGNFGG